MMKELTQKIRSGNRNSLSRTFSLLESSHSVKRRQGEKILEDLPPPTKDTWRIGITGPAGSGKSTFINALGSYFENEKTAVFAVDPSSDISGGSILGDKLRMGQLAVKKYNFIRPVSAGTSTGGIHPSLYSMIQLSEKAGFTRIIVETVGIGQNQLDVASVTDVLLYLHPVASGDTVQGIKRGVMEKADLILLNKEDLFSQELINATKHDLQSAHALMQRKAKIISISAEKNEGIKEVYRIIKKIFNDRESILEQRKNGLQAILMSECLRSFHDILKNENASKIFEDYLKKIQENALSPYRAGNALVKKLCSSQEID